MKDLEKQEPQTPSSATELTPLTPLTPVASSPKRHEPWSTLVATYCNSLKWGAILSLSLAICIAILWLFHDIDTAVTVEKSDIDSPPTLGRPHSALSWNDANPNIRNDIDDDIHDGDLDDDNVPLQRQDFRENSSHERVSITLAPPPFYLSSPLLSHPSHSGDYVDVKESIGKEEKDHPNNIRRYDDNSNSNSNNNGISSQQRQHPQLRWGILGPGRIAHDFTSALVVMGCNVTAVAASGQDSYYYAHHDGSDNSNTNTTTSPSALQRAKHFATHFSIPAYYGSYDQLATDPNVDIVYVATTNQNHLEPTLLMLRHDKNVLVEKPTTIRYEETMTMYDMAKERGLFLMTNHWTRFFPLIRFLRWHFLRSSSSSSSSSSNESSVPQHTNHPFETSLPPTHPNFHLGNVLAMHGDFSFVTPFSPSDRFLNRTLGGGVTLDVGCYLVELALLAAYDYREEGRMTEDGSQGRRRRRRYRPRLSNGPTSSLLPDDVTATGHGWYHGREFPVDVESSFALRWGGKEYGIWNGECRRSPSSETAQEFVDGGNKTTSTRQPSQRQQNLDCQSETTSTSNNDDTADDNNEHQREREQPRDFTMISTFQTSFRRPSSFQVEYVFEHGRIVLHGPGNCPDKMTVFEHQPLGSSLSLIQETEVSFPLPTAVGEEMRKRYGRFRYPRAEGFAYVIDAVERCMMERGVPGARRLDDAMDSGIDDDAMEGDDGRRGCLELEENTIEEQLVTVEITEKVLKQMGYFG